MREVNKIKILRSISSKEERPFDLKEYLEKVIIIAVKLIMGVKF